jgi:hypothetical protein
MVNVVVNLNRITNTVPIGQTSEKNKKSYKESTSCYIIYSSIVMREYVTTISIQIVFLKHVLYRLIKGNSERNSTTEQSIETVVNDRPTMQVQSFRCVILKRGRTTHRRR